MSRTMFLFAASGNLLSLSCGESWRDPKEVSRHHPDNATTNQWSPVWDIWSWS